MSNGRVGCDDQVEIHHDRGGIYRGTVNIQRIAKFNQWPRPGDCSYLFGTTSFLQTEQCDVRTSSQRSKLHKWRQVIVVIHISRIALLGDTHFQLPLGCQFLAPLNHTVGFGEQISNVRGNRRQLCLKSPR
jgi:hypothetical protein